MSTEQEIAKKDYMSVPELLDVVSKVKSGSLSSDEYNLMTLLDNAVFHVSELRIGMDKTREDLNRATAYANNLRTELKNLLDVAQSYLQESSMVRQQLDEVKKDINGNSN